MRGFSSVLLVGLCVVGGPGTCLADETEGEPPYGPSEDRIQLASESSQFSVALHNRLQVRWVEQLPDSGSSRGSFDLERYKLGLSGTAFGEWSFRLQADLARGSETSKDLLDDAYVQWTRYGMAQLRAGQGKVFFGRQELTSSGRLQFVDRSIASERFSGGRDVGLALVGRNRDRTYSYYAGVHSGSGANKDEDDNKGYMAVGRIVFTVFGPFALSEGALDRPETPKLAVGVSALSNTTGTEGIEEEHLSRGGLEMAFKYRGFSMVGEFFSESVDPVLGPETDTDGWYFQAGYLFPLGLEVAGRYSQVSPEMSNRDETEAGVAVSYYLNGHRHKVQADYRQLEFEATPFNDRDELRIQLQLAF